MKASIITSGDSKTSTFFSEKNIFRPAVLALTLAQFIIAAAKASADAIQAFILDRTEPNGSGRVIVLPASEVVSVKEEGTPVAPMFQIVGDKVPNSSAIRWGAGTVTADDIETAVNSAIATVGADLDEDITSGQDKAEFVGALQDVIFPDYAAISPRSGLERVLDLMIPARTLLAENKRLAVKLEQTESQVIIKFYSVEALGTAESELETDIVTADKHIADVEMKMPETAAVAASTPRLALE